MLNKKRFIENILKSLITIFFFLFIFTSSVKITSNFKALYYFDIKHLNIKKYTNLNKEQIETTYNYLVYYINSTKPIEFKIPLLPSSRKAITHFREVKSLFLKLDFILFISSIFTAFGIWFINKYRDFSPLKWCSNLLLSVCLWMFTIFFINFNKTFTTLHQILFDNNYWLFNPRTDPVISLLPEKYFLHCTIFIVFLILLWSLLLRTVYVKTMTK
jgi:integral membrane protein (TIGR01906 family)